MEEVGGLGANAFCRAHKYSKLPAEMDALKFLVEIDRRGSYDAVYYDCENLDFEKYITSKSFIKSYGSFSDISYVAPELGVAAVNLSSGYYNAHTQHEYIVRSELERTIQKVVEMIADADTCPKYDYVKRAVKSYDWHTVFYQDKELLYGAKTKSPVTFVDDFGAFDEEVAQKSCRMNTSRFIPNCLRFIQKKSLKNTARNTATKFYTRFILTNGDRFTHSRKRGWFKCGQDL